MRVRALFVYPEPTRGTHQGTNSTNPRRTTESCLTNRFGTVFSARQLSHDDAPTARSTPARGNAPGTCPSTCSALQGRRGPSPLQGAPIDSENQRVAPGLSATALSALESNPCKSGFATLDGWPFIRWHPTIEGLLLCGNDGCVPVRRR